MRPPTILGLALLIAVPSLTRAEEPPPVIRLVTASDLAAPGPDGMISLPRPGDYTVSAWEAIGESWSIAADGSRLTFSLGPPGDGSRTAPAWRALGRFPLDGRPRLIVAGPKGTKEPVPVPTLLAFATDPAADLASATDLARGRLDAIDPVADPRRLDARTRDSHHLFDPPTSRRAWLDRADTLRDQIRIALGLWPGPERTDLHPQILGRIERDGYTIDRVALETLPEFWLAGNLYRPTGRPGRLPLMLCPHGHWPAGRTHPDVQARCVWWAKRLGCVVFSYDMVGYNDSKPFGHAFLDDRLRRHGLSLAGLQAWNSLRSLDWLETLPDVDPTRIACTGESGGGTQTFLLAAIDDRVAMAAPVVMVSHKMQGGCLCENAAGLRVGTDNVEIASLIAPRPMKLVGANDWTDETLTVEAPTIRRIYDLLGRPGDLSASKYEFEHNYNKTSRESVYAFLAPRLAGISDPEAAREGEVITETAADLQAFGPGRPAPPGMKTPAEVEADLVASSARAVDRLAPGTDPVAWAAGSRYLRRALEVRTGVDEPPPLDLTTTVVRRSNREGLRIEHAFVTRTSTGASVPVVRLSNPSKATGRATLVSHPRGKAGLVGDDGKPSPIVRALLDRGQTVVGFDPIFVGEAIDPRRPAHSRPVVEHFATYNPSLPADRMADLAQALAWTKRLPGMNATSLVAIGESGPLALMARPGLAGLARTAIDLDGFSFGDGSTAVPPGLDLPGVLQFGGPPIAAALVAPAPLRLWNSPADPRAIGGPMRAYALADASSMLRIDPILPTPEALARWLDEGE